MRLVKSIGIIVLGCIVLMTGACAKSGAMEQGDAAPDFSLPDLSGTKMTLADFKGKVVILDFFATWCPPCREEIPDFIALQKAYGDKGFAMVGVSLVDRADAAGYAGKVGINYPVLIDDGSASNVYGPIRSIPTTFIIDRNGTIADVYIGYRPKDVFEKRIQELLK